MKLAKNATATFSLTGWINNPYHLLWTAIHTGTHAYDSSWDLSYEQVSVTQIHVVLRSILRSTSGPLQSGIGLACRRLTVWEGMDQASFMMRADTFAFFLFSVTFFNLDPQ